jgi:hypothetical protein
MIIAHIPSLNGGAWNHFTGNAATLPRVRFGGQGLFSDARVSSSKAEPCDTHCHEERSSYHRVGPIGK